MREDTGEINLGCISSFISALSVALRYAQSGNVTVQQQRDAARQQRHATSHLLNFLEMKYKILATYSGVSSLSQCAWLKSAAEYKC